MAFHSTSWPLASCKSSGTRVSWGSTFLVRYFCTFHSRDATNEKHQAALHPAWRVSYGTVSTNMNPSLHTAQAVCPSHPFSDIPLHPLKRCVGAILATIAFYACAFPRTTFLIFFVIPCPAWAFLPGILAFDVYRSVTDAVSWFHNSLCYLVN
jgi:hypothetical protein